MKKRHLPLSAGWILHPSGWRGCQVFLLDEEGKILFKGEGYADKGGKEELLEHIKVVCTSEGD
ncbi:MAG: hypothetical protein V5A66_03230 [Candidatus Thermoplasmatota archaeon]